MIEIGFAERDVTPPLGRPLGRLFQNEFLAEGVQWALCVRAMAIRDGDARAIIFSLDKNRLLDPAIAEIREAVAAATGLPVSHQFIACSHAHNVPFATNWLPGDTSGFAYLDVLKQAFCEAAELALTCLQPAHLFAASASVSGLNANRRPVYRTDIGEQVGTHGPTDHPDFLRLEGPADDELLVLVAEDRDGRTLGGLVNFACHPTTMYSVPVWSADFPGVLAEALSQEPGGVFLFLNGAAGNVSPAPGISRGCSGADLARFMGETLASKARESLGRKTEVADCGLSAQSRRLRIPQRRPTGEQIEMARRYIEEGEEGDPDDFWRRFYGYTYTMYRGGPRIQEWLCREVLGMWEWQRRVALREPADEVEILAIRLGNFGVVSFPSEIFSEFGERVKQQSPFAHTMVAEQANGWHGYIPTVDAFARGGYETSLAYQSHLVPKAGDQMSAAALELLEAASMA